MKKFIIAAAITVAAMTSTLGAANAQSVIITDGDGPQYHHRHYDHGDRGWHRGWDRPHFQHARCFNRTEKTYRHGHTMVRETQVCR